MLSKKGVFHIQSSSKKRVSRWLLVGYRDEINGVWRNQVS